MRQLTEQQKDDLHGSKCTAIIEGDYIKLIPLDKTKKAIEIKPVLEFDEEMQECWPNLRYSISED